MEELEGENQELVQKLHEEEANVRAWRAYASQPTIPRSSGVLGYSTVTTSTSTVSGGSASAPATRPRVTAVAPTYLSITRPTPPEAELTGAPLLPGINEHLMNMSGMSLGAPGVVDAFNESQQSGLLGRREESGEGRR